MAVCGRCFLCGSKFDCGPKTCCETCDGPSAKLKPIVFECPMPECVEHGHDHKICGGCLEAMHEGAGLHLHLQAVVDILLNRVQTES